MGLQETPECLTQGRLWTKGKGAFETLSTPQGWCACILIIVACWVYTMEEYISAETSFDKGRWREVDLPSTELSPSCFLALVLTEAS